MKRYLMASFVGSAAAALSVPVAAVMLGESPAAFGPERWAVLAGVGMVAALFTYREGGVRGLVAGFVALLTVCLALSQPEWLRGIKRPGWFFVLAANCVGVGRDTWQRLALALVLFIVATWAASGMTGATVLVVAALSWGQAELLDWLLPTLVVPLRSARRGLPYLIAFGLCYGIIVVAFAVLYNALYIMSGASFAASPGECLAFPEFLYQSVCVLSTAGPQYRPGTRWAQLLVALELISSTVLFVFYFALVMNRVVSPPGDAGKTAASPGGAPVPRPGDGVE